MVSEESMLPSDGGVKRGRASHRRARLTRAGPRRYDLSMVKSSSFENSDVSRVAVRLSTIWLALCLGLLVTTGVMAASEPRDLGSRVLGSAAGGQREDGEGATGPSLEDILLGYNEGIRTAMSSIDTLVVEQEMIEPQGDGSDRRAVAVLTYGTAGGMERDELSSEISYPMGSYTLESLVGPELLVSDYAIELVGIEEMEGTRCHRLAVTALERDSSHFDGTVWIAADALGLVRIEGQVADPPFPVSLITLDKVFEPATGGFRLLRRHSGEVRVQLGFVKKRGVRHIFYYGYIVGVATSRPDRTGG